MVRVGKCNINFGSEESEARVGLQLELTLPADPAKWTRREAQNWLCWLREAYDLEEVDITQFNMDGPGLCSLETYQIEDMLGMKAGNIFRTNLDLLKSTAALVRLSPPKEMTPPPYHFPICGVTSPPATPGLPVVSNPVSANTRFPMMHYQSPGVQPSINRSSVITAEDILRLQPVAGESTTDQYDPILAVKLERRRSSNSSLDSSIAPEDEEEKLNKQFNFRGQIKTNNGTQQQDQQHQRPTNNTSIDCGRQGVTLWQFILELLTDETLKDIVTWTENYLEFKVVNSKEMAIRWGVRKNRPKMNYDKLSRALRYYYKKNLIQHVPGKRQVYFFVEHPESLDFTQMLNNALATHPLRTMATKLSNATPPTKLSAFTNVASRFSAQKRGLLTSPNGGDTQRNVDTTDVKRPRLPEPATTMTTIPALLRYPGLHSLLGGIQIPTPANLAKLLNPSFQQQGLIRSHPQRPLLQLKPELMTSTTKPFVMTSSPAAVSTETVLDMGMVQKHEGYFR